MIIIDAATVAVETEAELRGVLSGSNAYTKIYLAADMQMTQGVSILAGKTSLVIDGKYPADGSGTIHTYTDMNSASGTDAINVSAVSGTLTITMQNMNITGRNYYGVVYVPDTVSGVTLNFINVHYTGPQFIYHTLGYNTITDCTFTSAASTACAANEMAELSHLTIGGNTVFNHQPSAGLSFIWFRTGSSPALVIAENASVIVHTSSYCFYTDIHPAITIGSGAQISFYPTLGMFLSTSHYANSLTMETDSALTIEPGAGATSANSPPLVLAGDMTVKDGAKVFIQSTLSAVSPLYFTTSAMLTITNPQSFVLYGSGAPAVKIALGTLTFAMSAEQINLWVVESSSDPGGMSDAPNFKWYRGSGTTPLSIEGDMTSSVCTVTSNNFTAQELSNLPALTSFLPETDQVLSLGKYISLNPIVYGQYPVSGTTMADADVLIEYESGGTAYSDAGTADSNGQFSVVPSAAIEKDASVTVMAHLPFLTGTVTQAAVDAGELSLEVPAADLPFVMEPLNGQNQLLYGRGAVWQQITVHDTRVYPTPWMLSATLGSAMTSKTNAAHALPGALIFIDTNNQTHILGSDAVTVFSKETASAGDTDIAWDETKGILLQGDDVTFFANEEYSANINWTLDTQ